MITAANRASNMCCFFSFLLYFTEEPQLLRLSLFHYLANHLYSFVRCFKVDRESFICAFNPSSQQRDAHQTERIGCVKPCGNCTRTLIVVVESYMFFIRTFPPFRGATSLVPTVDKARIPPLCTKRFIFHNMNFTRSVPVTSRSSVACCAANRCISSFAILALLFCCLSLCGGF